MTLKELTAGLEAKLGCKARTSSGGNGLELLFVCPDCKRRKLYVNPSKRVWHCWHCGTGGTLRGLLGRKVELSTPVPARQERRPAGYEPPGELLPLTQLPADHPANAYLRRRGFDPEQLETKFGICYCQRGRKYAGGVFDTSNTIVIPVTLNGANVAWQARLLYDPSSVPESEKGLYGWKFDAEDGRYCTPPKYFTMPRFNKGEYLFNMDLASKGELVVVTEGAFDAMRVGACAVAAFGKGLTDNQVGKLQRYWKAVVLLLDPDANEDQTELEKRLSGGGPSVIPVTLSGYKDAGEAPQEEIWNQIADAADARGVRLESLRFDI